MLRDRPAPMGLRFSPAGPAGEQAAWERLGSQARPWAHFPQGQDVAWDPGRRRFPPLGSCTRNAPSPGGVSQQEGVGADSSCLGQDPASGPGQLHRRPPLTSLHHLDSCQWPCSPALPCHRGRDLGINHCRPCLSQAETGPPRSAGIHPPCTKDWGGRIRKCHLISSSCQSHFPDE